MIDTSAMNRLKFEPVAARLGPLITGGLVATCGMLEIEALFSARSPDDYEYLRSSRSSIFSYLDTEEADWQEALDVQRALAAKSQQRGLKIPDLVIAAVAHRYDLTLLHFDSDFDRIIQHTGQKGEWVVPRGSIG
ncbi:PIN domain nuclease [Streptomyces sp. NPDC021020]|uniref:PIN domain nuclease n=1 Tax=Streptomyces sp. NPDC021020 TaxID=3365109 RepID=UPI0037AFB809